MHTPCTTDSLRSVYFSTIQFSCIYNNKYDGNAGNCQYGVCFSEIRFEEKSFLRGDLLISVPNFREGDGCGGRGYCVKGVTRSVGDWERSTETANTVREPALMHDRQHPYSCVRRL